LQELFFSVAQLHTVSMEWGISPALVRATYVAVGCTVP